MTVIQNEGLDVSDIVKSEPPSHFARVKRTIKAGDRATLGMGHVVELDTGEVTAQKAGGTTIGVCISKAPQQLIASVGYLDLADDVTDLDTVIIGAKTYTFKDTLSDTDGFVLSGANAAASIQNLVAAINGTVGTGTEWAASTVKNTQVDAVLVSATRMKIIAITAGSVGNAIATTETLSDVTASGWVDATLLGGQGDEPTEAIIIERGPTIVDKDRLVYGAGVVATVDTDLTTLGIVPRIEPATLETKR